MYWIIENRAKEIKPKNDIIYQQIYYLLFILNYVYLKINIILMFYFSDINSDHCKNAQSRGVRYWYHHKNKTLNNY